MIRNLLTPARWVAGGLLASALVLPSMGFAQTAPPTDPLVPVEAPVPDAALDGPALDALLAAVDGVPNAAQLRAAWPDAPARLAAAAMNPERTRYQRERATSLLSLFPEPQTHALLLGLVAHADADVRTMARYTLSRTFGATVDAAWVAQLEQVAGEALGRESAYAVRSLRWCDAPEADAALARLATSSEPTIARLAETIRVRRIARLGTVSLPFLGVD